MHGHHNTMKAGTARLGLLALVGAALALALFAAPASAKKTHLFLESFSSPEQPTINNPNGLAVDSSTGDLLVIDTTTDTVSRYHSDGTPAPFSALGTNVIDAKKGEGGKACGEEPASCDLNPEHPGFGFGDFAGSQQVAVDNSGTVTDGDIYVTQLNIAKNTCANFVDVFAPDGHYLGQLTAAGGSAFEGICGVAVDPGGNLFLAEPRPAKEVEPTVFVKETKIYKFDPSANPPLSADHLATFTAADVVFSLAAGAGSSAGALFAGTFFSNSGDGVLRFNASSGSFEGAIAPSPLAGVVVSVDPLSGHLFTAAGKELTAAGASVSTFRGGAGTGVAANGAIDRVYVSKGGSGATGEGGAVNVLGPIVTVPDVTTGDYEIIGDTSVRIKGTVNPDGQALTECTFEYGLTKPDQETDPYEHSVPCEAPDAAAVGSGAGPVEVHADLTLLNGEALYHYRLVAKNANAALYPDDPDAVVKGADQTFKTPSKPGIKGLWATNVIVTEATLKATLNPENAATTYRFEYGDQGPCDANPCTRVPALPAPEPSLGSDGADHTVGLNLSGLEPATTYHYRVVATNGIGISEAADHRFTTFPPPTPPSAECGNEASRIGFGALLPDCRAYEMVSPVDKGGGDIRVLETTVGAPAVLEQSTDSGERLAYGSVGSFGDAQSAPFTSQYIAQRIAGKEWQTHSINPLRGRSVTEGVLPQFDTEFKAFSADLCQAWVTTFAEPPLAEGGVAEMVNLYRRSDRLCGAEGYRALAPRLVPESGDFEAQLRGISADGEQAIFTTSRKLSEEGSEGALQLYESVGAAPPRFVCILPGGGAAGTCTAGPNSSSGDQGPLSAISEDGERIFFSVGAAEGKVYLRQNAEAPESARLHGAAAGKGNLIGPATGSGNAVAGSELLKGVHVESGGFAAGQGISDSNGGIPANTTIVKVEEPSPGTFTLTLSAKVSAGKTKLGDSLTGAASEKVPGIVTETGAFQAGQEISAANEGIPPGTTVLSCSPSCGPAATSLTLSAKATKTKVGAALEATSPCTEAEIKACTIAVSKAGEGQSGTSASWFWGAARSGAKAIFSTVVEGGASDLYEFDVDGEATNLLAEGVLGVMGISDNADRVYFASSKVLSGEEANSNGDKAQADKPNLYLHEAGGGTVFIGTLANLDLTEAISKERAGKRSARVSPDGLHAAFVSAAPLTGYDNKAAGNGAATSEVYRYDAETNELLCVSCNPSGARPAGRAGIPRFETALHAARVLAEDGSRLYFESPDALTPRDTNGAVDVYQWEEPGAGPPGAKCTSALPTYSLQDEGCIDLVSSGQSHLDSRFVEASSSGDDVFIATASSLLPQDPGSVDIYDARVNGGLPIPQGPPPSCEGEACQSAPAPPENPNLATAAHHGSGNVVEPATKPCPKGKVRRHGKCVKKKHKAKRKPHKKTHKRHASSNRRAAK